MYYAETKTTDPFYNLAFEEYILENRREGDWLLLWQNANAVIVGLNQNTLEEIDSGFVDENRIAVVRRITGGGAVYHDLGNLNYSFITDADAEDPMSARRFVDAVCRALESLGVKAEASGRNDICIEGRKVSGTAQRLLKNRILHHGTLLFDSNLGMVSGALKPDSRKFASKSAKSVRSRVANIKEFLREDLDIWTFQEKIKEALTDGEFESVTLSEEELSEIEALSDRKYRSWEWNFGRSPAWAWHNRARFPGGGIEVYADIEQGTIRNICFFGDYLARTSDSDLLRAMQGCRYKKDEVDRVLSNFPLSDIFGGITKEELTEVIFP